MGKTRRWGMLKQFTIKVIKTKEIGDTFTSREMADQVEPLFEEPIGTIAQSSVLTELRKRDYLSSTKYKDGNPRTWRILPRVAQLRSL